MCPWNRVARACHVLGVFVCLIASALRADEATDTMLNAARAHGLYTSGLFATGAQESGEAVQKYEAALKLQPDHARAEFRLGDLAFRRGELTNARKHYQRSIELEPDFVFARFNLACVLSRSGDTADALVEIEALLKLGYARWEKLQSDSDLGAVRARPEYAALIEKFRTTPVTPSRVTAFHLADRAGKLAMLEAANDTGSEPWRPLAAQALLEDDLVVRRTGIQMHRFFDALGSEAVFVRGLYDSNDTVAKAAGTALANLGTAVLPSVDAVLDSGDAHAISYARQIKALIVKPPKATPPLAPSPSRLQARVNP